VVEYADGSTEVHPVRNGYEITTATGQHGPSRIEPYAANAPRVFRYHYRFDWEHYVINLGKIAVDPEREIKSLILREAGNGYSLLVYGVSAKL
jgi:hypothetical protein